MIAQDWKWTTVIINIKKTREREKKMKYHFINESLWKRRVTKTKVHGWKSNNDDSDNKTFAHNYLIKICNKTWIDIDINMFVLKYTVWKIDEWNWCVRVFCMRAKDCQIAEKKSTAEIFLSWNENKIHIKKIW